MACDVGIVGLGTMGRNLALNLADQGFGVAVTDPWTDARQGFRDTCGQVPGIVLAENLGDLVAALSKPRRVILLVKAGEPVDAAITELAPLLGASDLIADAGNAHFGDSLRRGKDLEARGLRFLGTGLSGGAEGARRGACLMVGGPEAAYEMIRPVFEAVAAKVDGEACSALLGGHGAGHFVKTLHNGIEYAAMQAIAETARIMTAQLGLSEAEAADVFARWNDGPAGSYLVGITAEILRHVDPETGRPLVAVIRDTAGQKGTGAWAAAAALDLGVAAPTLIAAVAARAISALAEERAAAADTLAGPVPGREAAAGTPTVEALGDALLGATVVAYSQGFAVMAAAAEAYGWHLDLALTARIWRGGSILRARLLDDIASAYAAEPAPKNLLVAPPLAELLAACQDGWRGSVAGAIEAGLPVPALASALGYYDAYRSGRLWTDLIQAQRDFFGSHGFERIDRPGVFHGDWGEEPKR